MKHSSTCYFVSLCVSMCHRFINFDCTFKLVQLYMYLLTECTSNCLTCYYNTNGNNLCQACAIGFALSSDQVTCQGKFFIRNIWLTDCMLKIHLKWYYMKQCHWNICHVQVLCVMVVNKCWINVTSSDAYILILYLENYCHFLTVSLNITKINETILKHFWHWTYCIVM